ncbi:hypothetical protein G7Z17_g11812 [Cylindrodendrum hubeiense]|uniref:Ankyrin repeat protein n=1 Tax=Cylindrodendrum hubeiense TaxID=595255 RepID=A0A9P5GYU8_9HYPO|nr:hypothetical protein G7Z17_g11812 [Cylindrodendrum hubeiense]
MLTAEQRQLLIGVCLIPGVAADDGDDFANNLFSDLSPLLALFGERVTMQYMSQAMGWADNIVLAMAPLGIITAIVSAIRVGGPSWLKAIIGRARESRAIPEAELMSSTSKEVCELWNGHEIVRVMGEGPIREFIILEGGEDGEAKSKPQGQPSLTSESGSDQEMLAMTLNDPENKYLKKYEPTVRDMVCGMESRQNRDLEPGTCFGCPSVVIRNTGTQTPNLTLNVHARFDMRELYIVAAFGTLLQLGVLVYSGLTTYHPRLMLLKDGKPVADYAFSLTTVGTLLLVTGMMICSHVVESSTSETRYRPVAGRQARVVWLQRWGTVSDQTFESFAVFPNYARDLLTTSQRAVTSKRAVKQKEVVTVAGTLVCLSGFFVQFTGLRSMHWSASIAQLSATIVMIALRARVRRNLAQPPKSQPLMLGYELDWLAMTLGVDPGKAPWLDGSRVNKHKPNRPWAEDGWDWKISGVQDPAKCKKLNPRPAAVDMHTNGRKAPQLANEDVDLAALGGKSDARSNADGVMKLRRDLGKLADWYGPASAEAICLSRAIEITMDTLFDRPTTKLSWCLEVRDELIHFRLERGQAGSWKAFSDEIEAALSLWLYSIHSTEPGLGDAKEVDQELQANDKGSNMEHVENKNGNMDIRRKHAATDDDAWLRAKGTLAKRSLRLLGSSSPALRRDLRWWMPDGDGRIIEIEKDEPSGEDGTIEVEADGVTGFVSDWSRGTSNTCRYRVLPTPESGGKTASDPGGETANVILATESYNPLKTELTQYMFSAFMWAVAKSLEEPMSGAVEVRPTDANAESRDSTWQSFALHSDQLSKMARDIQNTGIGTLEEIYLGIIPPMSAENRLPRADAIIRWTRKHVQPHEQLGRWNEAGNAYVWLFQISKTFPRQGSIAAKSTALLTEYLRAVTAAIKLRKAQQFDPQAIKELVELELRLRDELKSAEQVTLAKLKGLYETQKRSWECDIVETPEQITDKDTALQFTNLHWVTSQKEYYKIDRTAKTDNVNDKDILDWTPLHYAAAVGSLECVQNLLQHRPHVNAQDLRGQTPLHLACLHNNASIIQTLLRGGANINMRDTNGCAPLHRAAANGHKNGVQSLIEAGADVNLADGLGHTAFFWTVYKGRSVLFEDLWSDAHTKLRDQNGRTPLHLAAIAEVNNDMDRGKVVGALVEKLKAEINAKDRFGQTPLHLGAAAGHEAVVQLLLLDQGTNKEAKNGIKRTPLHLAAAAGHHVVVKLLLDQNVKKEAKDEYGRTPLHLATAAEHDVVVQLLLDRDVEKEAKDNFGKTPLHRAAVTGNHIGTML